ncbi:MAG: heparinase II/III family protein [Armatimonadota bacterium]
MSVDMPWAIISVVVLVSPVAAAQVEHPVYASDFEFTQERLQTVIDSSAPVMAMSEDQVRALITDKAGFNEIRCANCTAGHQGNQLVWSADHPDQLTCRYCGHVYPSEQYPMDKVYEHVAPTGETQQYPYYEGPDGFQHFFQAKIDYHARYWAASMAFNCARAYYWGGGEDYARRAVLILHRMAEVYPHLPIHGLSDYSFRRPVFYDNDPPHPYLSQKLGSTWFYNEISHPLVMAYDLSYNSPAWDELSERIGEDARALVERDLIRAMADFSLQQDQRWLTNMTPSWCRGLITVGRVTGEPRYVHLAAGMLRDLLRQDFMADGMWKEGSVSYHSQTVGGLRNAWNAALGYSDPPGYTFEETGERFDDLDPFATETFLHKCLVAHEALAYPDGTFCCVHDTWASQRTQPEDPAAPRMLWAMGHAILGSGAGEARAQAQLHFSGSHGHAHCDPLNLTFWAGGRELVSDLGYTHTIYRRYSTSSAAHNLVVVDECDTSTGRGDLPWTGEMRLWEPRGPLAQAVSVDQAHVYPATSRYQRTVVLVSRPDAPGYLVDLFDVEGGAQHDWLLRGSADADQTATSPLPMTTLDHSLLGPGREMVPYINEGGGSTVPVGAQNANVPVEEGEETQYNVYGLLRDLRQVATDDDFTATFAFAEDGPPLTVTVLGAPGSEYFLATGPSIRRAEEDSAKLDDFLQPVIVARRRGEAPLSSRFASVLWPGEGDAPQVSSLRSGGEVVGVEVRHGEFRDLIIAPPEAPTEPIQIAEAGITTDAPLAVIRIRRDELIAAQATGGTLLHIGAREIALRPELRATITASTGGEQGGSPELTIEGDLPADLPLAGRPVLVEHTDGRFSLLEAVRLEERDGAQVLVCAQPPDFTVAGETTSFHYYPVRQIEGHPTLRIQPLTTWGAE